MAEWLGVSGWGSLLELVAGVGCWSWWLELVAGVGSWSRWLLELVVGVGCWSRQLEQVVVFVIGGVLRPGPHRPGRPASVRSDGVGPGRERPSIRTDKRSRTMIPQGSLVHPPTPRRPPPMPLHSPASPASRAPPFSSPLRGCDPASSSDPLNRSRPHLPNRPVLLHTQLRPGLPSPRAQAQ